MTPDELNPVTARLADHAVASLAGLLPRGYTFDVCYQLAVGVLPGRRGASLAKLAPSELEALIDLGLTMDAYRSVGDRRPPETHLEVLSVLRRLGGTPCYLAGRRTPTGHNIDERHAAAVDGRPLRFVPSR